MPTYRKNEKGFRPVNINTCGRPPLPEDNWPYPRKPHNGYDPNYGIRNPKSERHIYISKDQVFYDIDAQLGIISNSRRKADGTEDETLTLATTNYNPMFCRWIDGHIGEAKTVMSAFVLEDSKTAGVNSIKDMDEVDITLLMPEWYDDTVFSQLIDAIHSYVVNATLRDYLVMSLTSKDPVTIDKASLAEENKSSIRQLINASKPGRIRKHLSPF